MNPKHKTSITARSVRPKPPNAIQEQLDVAILAISSGNISTEAYEQSQAAMSQVQETRGEHSPENLTPTSVVNLLEDDGLNTPEGAMTPETQRVEQDEQIQRGRNASLDETREASHHQRERNNSAAP